MRGRRRSVEVDRQMMHPAREAEVTRGGEEEERRRREVTRGGEEEEVMGRRLGRWLPVRRW